MKKFFLNILFISSLFLSVDSRAQAFADEIEAFKRNDSNSNQFVNQHPIVFVGSSSFRKWENIQSDFSGYPILNRGFGGSTLPDVIFYAQDIILKYTPRQVVIYCGENDLASSDTVTSTIVLENFKKIFYLIRNELPRTSIVFVSIKPSPSRKHIQPEVIRANRAIKSFLKKKKRADFVDIYSEMLNEDGSMRKELFVDDELHMNKAGYSIWQRKIEPYLIR